MLTAIQIHDFTLVQSLDIDFERGLSAITGETGTGKSLVLDALSMALGDRADTNRIRQGANKATITACFDIRNNTDCQQWLEDNDYPYSDDECLLRRSFTSDGRSKGSINGHAATMSQLRTLGEMLVDIHSQHEHQSLLRKESHRLILDGYAQSEELSKKVQQKFHQWQAVNQQIELLTDQSDAINERKELLAFQLEELNQLALKDGDIEAIEQQHKLLSNSQAMQGDSFEVLQLLADSEHNNVEALLSRAINRLDNIVQLEPSLEATAQMLNSALIEVQEAKSNIQHQLDSFDDNPQLFADLEEQLATIHQLARKHRVNPEDLVQTHAALQQEFEQLCGDENNLDALIEKRQSFADDYLVSAQKLTKTRSNAAKTLSKNINIQLQRLAMNGASILINLAPTPEGKFTATGLESIEFLISTNPGQAHGALAKIASGGELSRISLAIQVVVAEHCQTPTLVFDEVDVGIGGATASVVGQLLRTLGESGQVICVTHLPQVASYAHQQLLAEKSVEGQQAQSRLSRLDEDNRIVEIARMLGAGDLSDQALNHAKEMLMAASRG